MRTIKESVLLIDVTMLTRVASTDSILFEDALSGVPNQSFWASRWRRFSTVVILSESRITNGNATPDRVPAWSGLWSWAKRWFIEVDMEI